MTLCFEPVEGIGEIAFGDDIAALITGLVTLRDRDVVVVTSKIVSKAAGLATSTDKSALLAAETDRVVAMRGATSIVRTHHGLTMAAAGIDTSNTAPGTLLPLPRDPDGSARALRARLQELSGAQVAVIISDTAGRAWRIGQTDIAIGCAGIAAYDSFAGRTDPYGNELAVTAPAIADEIAGGAELASGKFGGLPVVVLRGASPDWFTTDDGAGASGLIRREDDDLFGLGAREAVVASIGGTQVRGFPSQAAIGLDELIALGTDGQDLPGITVAVDDGGIVIDTDHEPSSLVEAGALRQRLSALGVAYGLSLGVTVTFH
jgi:coenzyme F420-0:L-glutamate ligase/coenzyme F420-1:gamma-L-glutamate ligase